MVVGFANTEEIPVFLRNWNNTENVCLFFHIIGLLDVGCTRFPYATFPWVVKHLHIALTFTPIIWTSIRCSFISDNNSNRRSHSFVEIFKPSQSLNVEIEKLKDGSPKLIFCSVIHYTEEPSWKPGFETHLFHTTANEFRLMHSLPRRQMNHGYCPNFHDGKQITRTASFPTCVPYPLERPNWITFLK
ncbi:hypothetical protein BD560DRAFT_429240 [Blakeslea trispora]|nr:hypothetical protein BD560DRAFT_429240 [Blakeslea trispora]